MNSYQHNKEFKEKHPNYCQTCAGWGGFSSPGDWVPYGSTSAQLPNNWDPCPDCAEENRCPWCGGKLETIEEPNSRPPVILTYLACQDPDCGWKENDDPDGLIDDEPDPSCYHLDWE